MKLKQVLKIQEILDGTQKATPVDMAEKWVYYSESREEWVDIMELDIVHAIRILRLHVGSDKYPHIGDVPDWEELKSLQEIT
jgi:hypothetical protein